MTEPMQAVWTSELAGAAKSVVDVAPDTLAVASLELGKAFTAYRALALKFAGDVDRSAVRGRVDDEVGRFDAELSATTRSLIESKQYKNDAAKSAIDAAKAALAQVNVALLAWHGDVSHFDGELDGVDVPDTSREPTSGPTGGPTGGPTSSEPGGSKRSRASSLAIFNSTPYELTVAAKLASEGEWTDARPDRSLVADDGKPLQLGGFAHAVAPIEPRPDARTAAFELAFAVRLTGAEQPLAEFALTADGCIVDAGDSDAVDPVALQRGANQGFAVLRNLGRDEDGVWQQTLIVISES